METSTVPYGKKSQTETSTIPSGTKLLQAYEIISRLGGGGMADVYKVRHSSLGEKRAIKIIRADLSTNEKVQKLFLREAQALKRIQHPAIVRCYEFLPDEQRGVWCMIMEMVEGTPLSVICSQRSLKPSETIDLLRTLADGLDASHRAGVVHRDLSPDNVILPDEKPKNAKLIDFGIAKIDEFSHQTIIGSTFSGKYGFASPEQFGMFGGRIDRRSDIYSLGLVIAAASLGRNLEMGKNFYDAIQRRHRVPGAVGVLPEKIRPTVARMLAPDPRHRFQSMRAVIASIEHPRPGSPSSPEEEAGFSNYTFSQWMLPEPATHSASRENLYAGKTKRNSGRFAYRAFLLIAILAIVGGAVSEEKIRDWFVGNIKSVLEKSESVNPHSSPLPKNKIETPTIGTQDRQSTPQAVTKTPPENAIKRTLKGLIKEPPRTPAKIKNKKESAEPPESHSAPVRDGIEKPSTQKKESSHTTSERSSVEEHNSDRWKMTKVFRDVVDRMFR